MKWRRITVLVLLALAGAIVFTLLLNSAGSARKTADDTRRALREQGLRLEFKDFERTNAPDVKSRLERLIQAGYASSGIAKEDAPRLSRPVGTNALVVLWNQPSLPGPRTEDLWPTLRQDLAERGVLLDEACSAALAGPIVCQLGVLWNGELINTNLSAFKQLTFGLTYRMLLELHDRNRDGAWTNLMALTRLITAWDIEPAEISHMARMANMMTVELATWQALQNKTWTDTQLAALQHEWDSLKLLDNLNETAALAGANAVMMCRLDRETASDATILRQTATELLHSPRAGWHTLVANYRDLAWRNQGSYEYENALMLYFGKREQEINRAISVHSWLEMRGLPGVTNVAAMPTTSTSTGFLLTHQIGSQSPSLAGTLFGRAAMCESKRRLLVTAFALERYRLQSGTYPQSLVELRPKLLTEQLLDFMDGKPLHYSATNGYFLLYSVGLDCEDQGGDMTRIKHWHEENGSRGYSLGPENDLVWPRPTLPGESDDQ